MPGAYLIGILIGTAGIAVCDWRWRLAVFRSPARTVAAVAIGVAFFLLWDAAGIATASFHKGTSPFFVGWDLAPHLPVEEVFFLTFLCYQAMVYVGAAERLAARRRRIDGGAR